MRKKYWILLLIPLIVSMAMVNFARATQNCVYVDPAVIWDTGYDIGDTVPVEIKVDYVENLWSFQIELSFNPAILQIVSVVSVYGEFLSSAIPPPSRPGYMLEFPDTGPTWDNVEGTMDLYGWAIKLQPPPPPWYFPTGTDGLLATVTFEVVGEGMSGIVLGPNTALFDPLGHELPPMSTNGHGLFINTENPPELYIRTRGAHAGGVWPEWASADWETEQTLYSRIMNYGEQSADVKVVFTTVAAGYPKIPYHSDVATIDAATWVGDELVPADVTVSVSFPPDGPGHFHVGVELYLGAEMYPYTLIEGLFGGVGVGKETAVVFKAK
jgi:hypothetical protein